MGVAHMGGRVAASASSWRFGLGGGAMPSVGTLCQLLALGLLAETRLELAAQHTRRNLGDDTPVTEAFVDAALAAMRGARAELKAFADAFNADGTYDAAQEYYFDLIASGRG